MAKLTTAELRAREVTRLAEITNDYTIAASLMRRYYRLAGALSRLLVLNNDYRTAETRYTQELSKRTERQAAKLDIDFRRYGLQLVYYSHLPTITTAPGNSDVIHTYFYAE